MQNLSVNIRAIIFVLLSFASYNIADAFVKKAQDYYSFAEAALYPVICYFFLTIVFSKKLGSLREVPKTKKLKLHLIRAFFGTGCFICMVLAFKLITLAEAYTLFQTAPFWIAILSIFFFKEFIGSYRWVAITVGFIGVLIILRPGIGIFNVASLLPIFAALCFSVFVIYTKKIGSDEPLINMVIFPIISDIIILIPIIIFMGNWTPPQWDHTLIFALSGAFYLLGTSFASIGYSSGDSSLLGPIQYSQILWGALIGYVFFAEIPEKWTLIGAVIIVLSGIYLVYREHLNQNK